MLNLKLNTRHLLCLFIICSLTSCTAVHQISVQLNVPAECLISDDIRSIAVFNRSMTPHFTNLKYDSIPVEKRIGNNDLNYKRTFFDSIAADTVIKKAARAIFNSQRFDVVVPLKMNIPRDGKNKTKSPLDSMLIKNLCKDYKVDGILVLESFSERISRKIHSFYNFDFWGEFNLTYHSFWRFYQPDRSPRYLNFPVSDKIYWFSPERSTSLERMYRSLPTIKVMLILGAGALGLSMEKKFVPNWINEPRYYFSTGKKEIDAAIPFIFKDQWDKAEEIWMKHSNTGSKTLRSRIACNLALCQEMRGNQDKAIELLTNSLETKYYRTTELYLKRMEVLLHQYKASQGLLTK